MIFGWVFGNNLYQTGTDISISSIKTTGLYLYLLHRCVTESGNWTIGSSFS